MRLRLFVFLFSLSLVPDITFAKELISRYIIVDLDRFEPTEEFFNVLSSMQHVDKTVTMGIHPWREIARSHPVHSKEYEAAIKEKHQNDVQKYNGIRKASMTSLRENIFAKLDKENSNTPYGRRVKVELHLFLEDVYLFDEDQSYNLREVSFADGCINQRITELPKGAHEKISVELTFYSPDMNKLPEKLISNTAGFLGFPTGNKKLIGQKSISCHDKNHISGLSLSTKTLPESSNVNCEAVYNSPQTELFSCENKQPDELKRQAEEKAAEERAAEERAAKERAAKERAAKEKAAEEKAAKEKAAEEKAAKEKAAEEKAAEERAAKEKAAEEKAAEEKATTYGSVTIEPNIDLRRKSYIKVKFTPVTKLPNCFIYYSISGGNKTQYGSCKNINSTLDLTRTKHSRKMQYYLKTRCDSTNRKLYGEVHFKGKSVKTGRDEGYTIVIDRTCLSTGEVFFKIGQEILR